MLNYSSKAVIKKKEAKLISASVNLFTNRYLALFNSNSFSIYSKKLGKDFKMNLVNFSSNSSLPG